MEKNLRPFDLSLALSGAKVITRDGREVTQLHKFEITGAYLIHGVLGGEVENWTKDGIYNNSDNEPDDNDLFLAPSEVTLWVPVIKHQDGTISGLVTQSTKEIADDIGSEIAKRSGYLTFIGSFPITITE